MYGFVPRRAAGGFLGLSFRLTGDIPARTAGTPVGFSASGCYDRLRVDQNVKDKPTSRMRKVLKWLALLVGLVVLAGLGYFLVVRYALSNFHTVVDGQVYRSAQPSGEELKKWISRYGLKTVINLRGKSDDAFYEPEREVLASAGVTMIDIRLTARYMPTTPELKRLIAAIETSDRPILLHCRDGIDRGGVASVIAAMALGGVDYATARKQLSIWTFHGGGIDKGIAELLLEYEKYCDREDLATSGWEQFRRWATTIYHPYYYFIEIVAAKRFTCGPGAMVRLPVRIINRSDRTIPAGDPGMEFLFMSFRGVRTGAWPEKSAESRGTRLPRQDVQPGQSVELVHEFKAPTRPGRFLYQLDVYADDKKKTLFGREGSVAPVLELIVHPWPGSRPGDGHGATNSPGL